MILTSIVYSFQPTDGNIDQIKANKTAKEETIMDFPTYIQIDIYSQMISNEFNDQLPLICWHQMER